MKEVSLDVTPFVEMCVSLCVCVYMTVCVCVCWWTVCLHQRWLLVKYDLWKSFLSTTPPPLWTPIHYLQVSHSSRQVQCVKRYGPVAAGHRCRDEREESWMRSDTQTHTYPHTLHAFHTPGPVLQLSPASSAAVREVRTFRNTSIGWVAWPDSDWSL